MLSFREIKKKDGRLILARGYYGHITMEEILSQLNLEQESINMFGKKLLVPRLVDYQGELAYKYAGVRHPPKIYGKLIKPLVAEVSESINFRFNSVLFNYYKNGDDYMGYHKDDEAEIDHSYIASVSFGAERKFNFKHEDGELFSMVLNHGDLLVMENFQDKWKHALPKSKKVTKARLNLTLRRIMYNAK